MGKTIPQNKFEVLSNRVMQSGKEEQYIRRQEMEEARVVRCFKCGKKGHKCRDCPKRRRRTSSAERGKKGFNCNKQE